MGRGWLGLFCLLGAGLLGACELYDVRATLHYNFLAMEEAPVGAHYQQFAEVDQSTVDLGCFVMANRQTNCFDVVLQADGTAVPLLRPAIVTCECPCTTTAADPCDPAAQVIAGDIRGTVDHRGELVRNGGVEIPTEVDLGRATELFITVEPDDDGDAVPSLDVLLRSELRREGPVLRGDLVTPTTLPVSGRVTIVPVEDSVWN
jgi:hypothetical protein